MCDSSLCNICPRECNVNRDNNLGFCKETNTVRLARASLHYWEEPCISGTNGSGTVFFTGCNLKCIFCQNREIALGKIGKEVTIDRLVQIYFELKDKKAYNINLVTPTHFTNQIIESIIIAKKQGFDLPFVYNTSGYEKAETIKKLSGLIDVYLTDFKYYSNEISKLYSGASNYFEYASSSLQEMFNQKPSVSYDNNGIMNEGIIVRHLCLPGHVDDSKNILNYLFSNYENNIVYSIMNQYTPPSSTTLKYEQLNRKLTKYEYNKIVDYAKELGITNAYIQYGETQKESFIPSFDLSGI